MSRVCITIMKVSTLACFAVIACAQPTATGEKDEIFFPRQQPPRSYMEALWGGTLEIQGRCLVFPGTSETDRVVPVWPHDSQFIFKGGQYVVLDAGGTVRVRVGEPVSFGGGFVSTNEGLSASLDPEEKAALVNTCPGTYWFVGEFYQVFD